MKIAVHCFAYNTRIDPPFISFEYNNMLVNLKEDKRGEDKYELTLEVILPVDVDTLRADPEKIDELGKYLEKRMRPYKEIMEEVSHLVEGILSLKYFAASPKFETEKITANVLAENDEEAELLKSNTISRGFGDIYQDKKHYIYSEANKITELVDGARKHIPALSFLSQATRSAEENNHEVAFFLLFRIIEGYMSDGSKDIEKNLLKNEEELKKYFPPIDQLPEHLKKILDDLNLPSKSNINFSGIISDLILIRHKLTHFSETNSSRHHNPSMLFELEKVNRYLRWTCMRILVDRIKKDKNRT